MASDTVIIRDLLVRGIIGVNDWEREKKQDIVINLSLSVDARAAGESDDVADVLNYRTLTKRVIAHVERAEPYLVEALAHQIARIAIVDFGAVRAEVRVEKPGALRYARSVGVEVERTAADYA
ncbi:MAG: dihydroneopterin aldolase [Gemmatimonadales bacterium]|nr:dihydroneopterin aldolase [Gemmatimonadales bacterium]MYG18269.1 dihydroneopterin aldolase [Gemmatimonadales bacterium]MYH10114.1 dihydroneopterin aldolase [Gemmatimonadales bacterium]